MASVWPATVAASLLLTLVATTGCHFRLASYDNFDDWFVGRKHMFDADTIGVGVADDTFVGYVVNDWVVRAPVFVASELVRATAIPRRMSVLRLHEPLRNS